MIGLFPILTNGFSINLVSSLNREPNPPANITNFINYFNSQIT